MNENILFTCPFCKEEFEASKDLVDSTPIPSVRCPFCHEECMVDVREDGYQAIRED